MIRSRQRMNRGCDGFSAQMESLETRCFLSASPAVVQVAQPLVGQSRQAEYLDRGIVAIRESSGAIGTIYVGWRLLGTDPSDVAFNLYCSTNGGSPVLLNTDGPLTQTTNFVQLAQINSFSHSYFVKPVINGVEGTASESYTLPADTTTGYMRIPLQPPPGGTTPDGVAYTYSANDGSVGDLDGDGQYEIILKWDPSNSKDNSQSGYTGNVYLDAYKLNGTRLWRIDLGKNIRAGAHYTQFMVYDLNGDGRAEVACKTAPGTKDGLGNNVILGSDDPNADFRNSGGYILAGPEYLTIFDGLTGANLATTNYNVPRGTVGSWGDSYGNRVDRFLACIAYLDGVHPSLVMCRGYYTRTTLTAWDWNGTSLTQRWLFDSNNAGLGGYAGQGYHNLSVADVDSDGKDEIIYGSCVINDNGTGLFTTGLGHGDAGHVTDLDPLHPGLEVFGIHEDPNASHPGAALYDAATGAILWGQQYGLDVGRGLTADIDPNYPGEEAWTNSGGLWNIHDGSQIGSTKPSKVNFAVWWDDDLSRELEDGTSIYKWNPSTESLSSIFSPSGLSSNNSTKSNPVLSGDILGDWREEVVWRTTDSSELRIFSTVIPANNRMVTLMHDSQYRESIAWQNVAYNQPPHTSFFLGNGMSDPPAPNIYTVQNTGLPPLPPSNFTAVAAGLNQIDLAWTASAGAVSYKIKRATSESGTYTTIAGNVLGTTYSDNTVTNGMRYYYQVIAVNGAAQESVGSTRGITRVPIPGAITTVYTAEAASHDSTTLIEDTNSGSNGKAYANLPATGTAGYLEFTNVDGRAGGSATINFRYASTASRTGNLIVNGVTESIAFNSSGALTTWALKPVVVALNAGATNTIRLQVTGADLPNIDELQVTAVGETTAPDITISSHTYATSPNKLTFTFTEAVNPSAGLKDLVVTRLSDGQVIIPTAFTYNTSTQQATFTLPTGLIDGNYRISFVSGGVIDTSGNALSNAFAFDFFVLGGDANHDRSVDLFDMLILDANWLQKNRNFLQGDFNYNGTVNAADLTIVAHNWQVTLDAPAPPTAPPVVIEPTGPASQPGESSSTYLSDLTPVFVANGWGAFEKDRSNGEQNSGDGKTITLNSVKYDKGLGVHAGSTVSYNLDGKFSTFMADVGVDDEVGKNGSVIFQVFADSKKVFDSGKVTGTSATKSVQVDVAGASVLKLVVTDAGNGRDYDHADWAGARLIQQSSANVLTSATPNLAKDRTRMTDLISQLTV